jgi:hypothetical protein
MRVFQAGLVHSVADPQKSQKEFGLDFADTFVTKTRDGIVYTAFLGSNSVPSGRYAKLKVEYEKPSAPTLEEVKASMPPSATTLTNAVASTNDYAQQINEEFDRRTKAFEEKSTEVRKRVDEQNAAVSQWVYVLNSFVVDSMMMSRDKLVKKVEAPTPEATPKE